MMLQLEFFLTLLAALGSGLMAGTFFAFSTFVMRALGRLPAEHGIAAMQSINVVVLNPVFLGVFLGTGLLSGALAVMAWLNWEAPGSGWALAGCLAYLIGALLVTMACNVPLNNALTTVVAGTPQGAELWTRYLTDWTAWNHVRTIAPLAALACFIVSLRA